MVPGFHFIFGARLGFTDEIMGKDERIRSIFPIYRTGMGSFTVTKR